MKVYLLCGNGMNFDSDYSYVIPWLDSQGFSCSILSPEHLPADLSDTGIPLVVFGSSKLSDIEGSDIENFLLHGGKAFFAVSPFRIDISGNWGVSETVHDSVIRILSANGIEFGKQLVADSSCARITLYNDKTSQQLDYPLWITVLPQKLIPQGMTLHWAAPITFYNENVMPLILTSTRAWLLEKNASKPDSHFETNPLLFTTEGRQNMGNYVLGCVRNGPLEGIYNKITGPATKIIVVSDQYFVNSLILGYTQGPSDYQNLEALTTFILDLSGETELASLQNLGSTNFTLYKIRDQQKFKIIQRKVLVLQFLIIPIFYLLSGFFFILIRKVKNR